MINFLLDLLTFLAIISSVLVITSKNPVIAVIFLISVFINTAGYLIISDIGFVGLSYIIVYIGAITVLFLFIIMMINIRLVDILELGNEYTKNLPLALLLGFLFVFEIFTILPFTFNNIGLFFIPVDIFNYLNNFILQIINILGYSYGVIENFNNASGTYENFFLTSYTDNIFIITNFYLQFQIKNIIAFKNKHLKNVIL